MKSEGVRDVLKWVKMKCKQQKACIECLENGKRDGSFFMDKYIDSYIEEEKIRLETLVEVKISIEKYLKKLKYQGE